MKFRLFKKKKPLFPLTTFLMAGVMAWLVSCQYIDFPMPGKGWPGNGNALFVATDGDDNNDGTKANPFATIQHAVELAQAGDYVIIRGGSYHQEVYVNQSGTEMNPIVIGGYPGEEAIIEGDDALPTGEYPGAKWKGLVEIRGDYIEVRNLTVQNSRGRGVAVVDTEDVAIKNVNSNNNWNAGIHVLRSENTIVEDCEIWENAYSNAPPNMRAETWSPALNNVNSNGSIIRNNKVYQNYGEGIDDLRSDNSIIEDNIAYDNWSLNIYLDNSQHTLLNGNISYATNNIRFWRYSDNNPPRPSPGIVINDEPYSEQNPAIDQIVTNNMVLNQGSGIAIWGIDAAANIVIANNTVINTLQGATGNGCEGIVVRGSAIITNSKIVNNLVYNENFGPLVTGSTDGITFSNNNWSDQVGTSYSSPHDVVCDPALAMNGSTNAGELSSEFFKLTGASPGIDSALVIEEVFKDAFGRVRGAEPDMGAHEYRGQREETSCGSGSGNSDLTFVSFEPVDDTFTNESHPDNNYGNNNNIQSNAAIGYRKTPFLKFDVSGIMGTVESVSLKLFVLNGTASGTTSMKSLTNDWTESEITWNNMLSGGTIVGTFYNVGAGEMVEIEILPEYVNGNGTFSFEVLAESTSGRIDYASKEYSTVSLRPVLEVGYGE